MQKNSMLVKELVDRGDYIAIKHGRIVIVPKSGKPVPDSWLKEKSEVLCREILEATQVLAFRYFYYTTGSYGVKGSSNGGIKRDGVTLHYANILTGKPLAITYNVELTRARNTKNGQKGKRLPEGRFRVRKGHAFVRFWQKLDLPLPARLSSFHDRMGRLGEVFVTGSIGSSNKVDKRSIEPLNISYDVIKQCITSQKSPENLQTIYGQNPDNFRTKKADKDLSETHTEQGVQAHSSACKHKYELSNQEQRVKEFNNTVIPFPKGNKTEEQTYEEWIDDYNRPSKY